MIPRQILEQTRQRILDHAGGDPDKWWYANRFVFARLNLDERRTKSSIKKQLIADGLPCHACGEPFAHARGVHIHRLDSSKGYSEGNCVLMHGPCHQKWHSEHAEEEENAAGRAPTLTKLSKRYDDKPFIYWWDISPGLAESLDRFDAVEFVKKDTGERCMVPPAGLKGFLTPDRQTSRGTGNWGVKVLKDREDELAFEPATGGGKWLFLPVVWIDEEED